MSDIQSIPQTVFRVRNFSNVEMVAILRAMGACSDAISWIGDRDARQCWEDYDFSDTDMIDWLIGNADGQFGLPTKEQ